MTKMCPVCRQPLVGRVWHVPVYTPLSVRVADLDTMPLPGPEPVDVCSEWPCGAEMHNWLRLRETWGDKARYG